MPTSNRKGNANETPKRGRPSNINKEVVIRSALSILAQNPADDVSMAEIAADLGIVTMGVYRHVRNKDELYACMAEMLFSGLDLKIDRKKSPANQIRQWARDFRAFFFQHPYASRLMARQDQLSTPLMNWTADLTLLLTKYGVPEKKLASTVTWLFRQIMAYILFEHSIDMNAQKGAGSFDLSLLTKDRQAMLAPLLPQIARYSADDLYRLHIDATMSVLDAIAADR